MKNPSPEEEAAHYDDFFGPLYFEPFALEIAGRLASLPISVALELAAGTGLVTWHLRALIPPSAKLTASDIDAQMLAVAKNKLAHLAIDWRYIDAQTLPFKDNSTDLIVCAFGYMFVPDKTKAFAEAYRILKPGGQLLFTTWDELVHNGASYLARSVTEEYLKDPFPDTADIATSMHDETALRILLRYAGYQNISVETIRLTAVCPTARAAAAGLVSGLVLQEIRKQVPEREFDIKRRLEQKLAQRYGSAPMTAPLSALLTQAWK